MQYNPIVINHYNHYPRQCQESTQARLFKFENKSVNIVWTNGSVLPAYQHQ